MIEQSGSSETYIPCGRSIVWPCDAVSTSTAALWSWTFGIKAKNGFYQSDSSHAPQLRIWLLPRTTVEKGANAIQSARGTGKLLAELVPNIRIEAVRGCHMEVCLNFATGDMKVDVLGSNPQYKHMGVRFTPSPAVKEYCLVAVIDNTVRLTGELIQ